jgi:hypothetical protein
MATITAGLILGVLAVSLLLAQTALAAGGVADEPCLRCNYEVNAARYGGLAEFYAAKLEASRAADAARYRGLAAEYTAREEVNLAAAAARYSDLAAQMAAREEIRLSADAARLSGLAMRDAERREAGVRAYADRYGDLADYVAHGETENVLLGASAERYTGLAVFYGGKSSLEQCC